MTTDGVVVASWKYRELRETNAKHSQRCARVKRVMRWDDGHMACEVIVIHIDNNNNNHNSRQIWYNLMTILQMNTKHDIENSHSWHFCSHRLCRRTHCLCRRTKMPNRHWDIYMFIWFILQRESCVALRLFLAIVCCCVFVWRAVATAKHFIWSNFLLGLIYRL